MMKKLLVFTFLAAFSVNAQNKLTAEVRHYYSDAVTLDGIDSIVYAVLGKYKNLQHEQPMYFR